MSSGLSSSPVTDLYKSIGGSFFIKDGGVKVREAVESGESKKKKKAALTEYSLIVRFLIDDC